jgi:hypothetical protein
VKTSGNAAPLGQLHLKWLGRQIGTDRTVPHVRVGGTPASGEQDTAALVRSDHASDNPRGRRSNLQVDSDRLFPVRMGSALCWIGHLDAGTAKDDIDASKPDQLWATNGGCRRRHERRAGAVKGLDSWTAISCRHDPSARVSEFIDSGLGLDYPRDDVTWRWNSLKPGLKIKRHGPPIVFGGQCVGKILWPLVRIAMASLSG